MNNFNLFEFVKMLEHTCIGSGVINSFYEGVYSVNASNDVKYPLIAFTVNSISKDDGNMSIDCNLLYADRLLADRSNSLAVQSVGVSFLSELINALNDELNISIQGNSMNIFTEQFADNCAGTVSRQTFSMPSAIAECYDLKIIDCHVQ